MTPDEYLTKVLQLQTFGADAPELKALRERRDKIKARLLSHFSKSSPSVRWAGSMAKGTMIRESYDGDMTVYFKHDEEEAGETLEAIYENARSGLLEEFDVERKASALRVRDRTTLDSLGYADDTHIDVVPGRFTSDEKDDVFLHQTTWDKARLKTNLAKHVAHIKESGVIDAIRLMKYWNVRNAVGAKTFILELLVVDLLKKKKDGDVSEQLEHIWTKLRDAPEGLSVKDPANPNGNDLKPALEQSLPMLSAVATSTLVNIEAIGWDSVFGQLPEEDKSKAKGLRAAAVASVTTPTQPWRRDG